MSLSGNLSMTRRCFFLTTALAAASPTAVGEARASGETDNLPKAVILTEGDMSTYLIVFHTDQEVMSGLLAFARKHKLTTGHLTGIGAISHVNIGYFDPATKQYLRSERNEQAEVLSFTGNLALIEKDPFFHVHVALALQDGSAFGGHLFEARIRPTLELVLTAYVILTNSEAPRDVCEAYSHRANCFITKPVDVDQFTAAVQTIEKFWTEVAKLPRENGS